jgi:membrane protein YdbS with pleckstrin-like domain
VAVNATIGYHFRLTDLGGHIASGCRVVLGVFAVVLGFKILYEVVYRFRYRYGLEAGHLVVKQGVITIDRGSFPLSRISRIHLERSSVDFLFLLYNVNIVTVPGRSAVIGGLTRNNAVALQDHLTSFIETVDSSLDKTFHSHLKRNKELGSAKPLEDKQTVVSDKAKPTHKTVAGAEDARVSTPVRRKKQVTRMRRARRATADERKARRVGAQLR